MKEFVVKDISVYIPVPRIYLDIYPGNRCI